MKKLCYFLTVMLFTTSAWANPSKKVVQEVRKAVMVYVNKPGTTERMRSATAFPINKTTFMTAGHFCDAVEKGAKDNKNDRDIHIKYINQNDEIATLGGGKITRYELSENNDVCLFELPKHGIKPVKFAKKDDAKFGDKVYTMGAPFGDFPILTEGYIGQPYSEEMSQKILNGKVLLSLPVIYGNSGGPLFNQRGEVIGIVVMVNTLYHHVSYAVPLRKIGLFMIGL